MASIWESLSDSVGSLFDEVTDSKMLSNGIMSAGKTFLADEKSAQKYENEAYSQGTNQTLSINQKYNAKETEATKLVDPFSVEAAWRSRLLSFANYEAIANRSKVK